MIAAVRPLFDALCLGRETAVAQQPQQEDLLPSYDASSFPLSTTSSPSSSTPQLIITINSHVEEKVTTTLSEAAHARQRQREVLCQTPLTVRLLFVTALGDGSGYWHAGASGVFYPR